MKGRKGHGEGQPDNWVCQAVAHWAASASADVEELAAAKTVIERFQGNQLKDKHVCQRRIHQFYFAKSHDAKKHRKLLIMVHDSFEPLVDAISEVIAFVAKVHGSVGKQPMGKLEEDLGSMLDRMD